MISNTVEDKNQVLRDGATKLLHSCSSRKQVRRFSAFETCSRKETSLDHYPGGHIKKERRYGDTATEYVRQKSSSSLVIKKNACESVPRLDLKEMGLGDLLGSGGFCDIRRAHTLSDMSDMSIKTKETVDTADDSSISADSVNSETQSDWMQKEITGYAIKYIRSKVRNDPDLYALAVQDLALEAEFLCNLDHPNIIKLHGMSASGFNAFDYNQDAGYFFMLEELTESLAEKRSKWMEIKRKHSSFKNKVIDLMGKERRKFFANRLQVALKITEPMKYLHERGIIFRDLKPQNIGFDHQGNLKLFDFGLAVEVNSEQKQEHGMYQLTGNTGTRRYMAPEVALMEPYNESADVYSFAIILWEICSLEKAFEGMSELQHYQQVYHGQLRPSLFSSWPKPLVDLMKTSWSHHVSDRPSFSIIQSILKRSHTKICK